MDRRVTPPKRVISPTGGLLPPCKPALMPSYIPLTLTTRKLPKRSSEMYQVKDINRWGWGEGGFRLTEMRSACKFGIIKVIGGQ